VLPSRPWKFSTNSRNKAEKWIFARFISGKMEKGGNKKSSQFQQEKKKTRERTLSTLTNFEVEEILWISPLSEKNDDFHLGKGKALTILQEKGWGRTPGGGLRALRKNSLG